MSLTDKDLRRVGEVVELSVLKAFDGHRKDDHQPLHDRIGSLKTKIIFWTGGIAGFAAAVDMAFRVWGK
jgi:hypothetical protein